MRAVFAGGAGGQRVVRVAAELIGEVDGRAADHEGRLALLGDAGDVVEDRRRVVGGRGERAAHRRRFRPLFEQGESGAVGRAADDQQRRRGQ